MRHTMSGKINSANHYQRNRLELIWAPLATLQEGLWAVDCKLYNVYYSTYIIQQFSDPLENVEASY